MKVESLTVKDTSLIVIFTAVTFVFTTIITISTPATRGFINIGETGVYLAALIGGPIVGAVAGGLGSALADLALGYAIYAPATLVIKGIEGYLAGFLARKFIKIGRTQKIALAIIISIAITSFLYIEALGGITLRFKAIGQIIDILIPFEIVMLIAIALSAVLILLASIGKVYCDLSLACLISGIEMVFGYYLYESLIFGAKIALIEVIPNFIQPIAGIIISIPLVATLMEMGVNVDIGRFISEISESEETSTR